MSGHPHALTIVIADITAGAMKDYHNGVTGAHTHSIILTAAEFADLAAGKMVSKMTNNEAGDNMTHSHEVQLICA
jgi:hypothetical protein